MAPRLERRQTRTLIGLAIAGLAVVGVYALYGNEVLAVAGLGLFFLGVARLAAERRHARRAATGRPSEPSLYWWVYGCAALAVLGFVLGTLAAVGVLSAAPELNLTPAEMIIIGYALGGVSTALALFTWRYARLQRQGKFSYYTGFPDRQ